MSSELPTISVTADKRAIVSEPASSSEDSNENDMDYGQNALGAATDVEDFDSNADTSRQSSRRPSNHSMPKKCVEEKQGSDDDITDIEDYCADSDDDEKSNVYPELLLSLRDFLQLGPQNQVSVETGGGQEICELKDGNFELAQNLDGIPDYLTDCEDYKTDSEEDYACDKSVCIDLNQAIDLNPERVSIADAEKSEAENSEDYEDVSIISDISDAASALSSCTGINVRGLSEDEIFEMSGDEEVCDIACSDSEPDSDSHEHSASFSYSSVAPIDVTFVDAKAIPQDSSIKVPLPVAEGMACLCVAARNEEVLTDVEGLDDSAAEDDSFDNEDEEDKPIPCAVILPVIAADTDDACQTDIEDICCEDTSSSSNTNGNDLCSITAESLPPPQREVILLEENNNGDTVANLMPMAPEYTFGIQNYHDDEVHTDVEEYSSVEDEEPKLPTIEEPLIAEQMFSEHEVLISNDTLKQQQSKRLEAQANAAEPVTDVEEFYVAGINRRKKPRNRSLCKAKSKSLEVGRTKGDEAAGITDVEDLELSDTGIAGIRISLPAEDDSKAQMLNEILNESRTYVHDESVRGCNMEVEKYHIKGMPRDAITDIEYVESDESARLGNQ